MINVESVVALLSLYCRHASSNEYVLKIIIVYILRMAHSKVHHCQYMTILLTKQNIKFNLITIYTACLTVVNSSFHVGFFGRILTMIVVTFLVRFCSFLYSAFSLNRPFDRNKC